MPNVKLDPAVSDRLCDCGCGQFTMIARVSDRSKGWVRGEGVRFVRGHSRQKAALKAEKRSWVVDGASGCWVWQGKPNVLGYGRIAIERGGRLTSTMAHRWVYEQKVGPIPEGTELHHVCENPICVNPGHLRPLTRLEHKQAHAPTRARRRAEKAGVPWMPFVCPREDCEWEGAEKQYEAPCPVHGRNLVPRK